MPPTRQGVLAGKELLKFANDETTIARLNDRFAKTIDYLKSVKQSEIDDTEDKDISITFPSGQTRQFTGQSLLLGNSQQTSGFTLPLPTISSGGAASRSASATLWARRRRRKPSCELTGASIATCGRRNGHPWSPFVRLTTRVHVLRFRPWRARPQSQRRVRPAAPVRPHGLSFPPFRSRG